ncbi:sulfate/molybdate ABC transporter ATP-binding protein [Desulfosporosinus sp. BICA1-9]|uniref:sulfate/molybdate ABC transporter ATP-binding protein n=1 Tax=Desulfosporosinus sp. BICA1-9 TaxID=1531958 RepID=UPI000A887B07|nr:ABC transporter ATP-binding protein [Desulfosporosinus sp. BICA1-9]HBW39006.1 molybdenum ABC transporter ATP-binding protein [Desulfosporosinus sp.]
MIEVRISKALELFSLQVDIKLSEGSSLALVGSSGCGKSMTLRMIAGLEQPDEGYVKVGNTVFYDSSERIFVPAYKRHVGFLFQNYALFPHLTVEQNIAFGLNHRHKRERQEKVDSILERLRLKGLEKRYPQYISGGQQQRVALARTLVTDPELLLLDEPFSALDSQVKKKMEKEVIDVRNAFSGTLILVTHSLEEAFRLCSNIAVMDNGKIIQLGTKDEIIRQPANRTVARLTGTENIFDGTVIERYGETARLWVEELNVHLTIPNTLKQDKLSLGIRTAQLIVEQDPGTRGRDPENSFSGRIVQTIPTPDGQFVFIQLAGDRASLSDNSTLAHRQRDYDLQAYVPFNDGKSDHRPFQPGDPCRVVFSISSIAVWPRDKG